VTTLLPLHWPLAVTSDGQVIVGGVVSTKVMCWTQVAVLPHPSVAFHVRSIPCTPLQPAGVDASVCVIVTAAGQLSLPVAEPVLDGSVDAPHSSCRFAGQVMVGGVVSTNVMCWTQVAVLPHPSVAFQVRSIPAPLQPAGVAASVCVIVTAAGQLSLPVAEPVLDGSVDAPHCS